MSERQIIKGRWVLTGDPSEPLHCDAAVVVEADRIVAVGHEAELVEAYPDSVHLGSDKVAVMPGFVNAHHHSHGTTTIQHGIPDLLLESWILSFLGMRSSDTYLNTLVSTARQLRTGVTSVVDVHSGRGASNYSDAVDAGLRAYEQCGMRVAFTTGVSTQSAVVHGKGQDQLFVSSLPAHLQPPVSELVAGSQAISDDDYLDIVEERVLKYRDHPLIEVWFGPPGPQWVSDELMGRIGERAEGLDTGVQTHCNESVYEKLHGPKFYRRSTMAHLQALGVLSPRFSIAHGVWLSEEEIRIMTETGAAISHNPSSNLRLRSGIAPLNALLEAGVTVGLGMDGTSINEDEDMFNEIRLAMRLHRTPRLASPAPRTSEVFGMATQGGARLMRKDHEIGRLAPGYKADLVLVDLETVTWPWVAPEVDPVELILAQAGRGDVVTVMIDGDIVLDEGKPTRFDLDEAGAELAQSLAATPFPAEGAALARELAPYLESWYESWEMPVHSPFIAYNSRV